MLDSTISMRFNRNQDLRSLFLHYESDVQDIAKYHAIKLISLKRNEGVGR